MVAHARLFVLAAALCVGSIVGAQPDYVQLRIRQLAGNAVWPVLDWQARGLPAAADLLKAQISGAAAEFGHDGPTDAWGFWQLRAREVARYLAEQQVPTLANVPLPPVVFMIDSPPRLLVVSPRDRIELTHSLLLDPAIDLERIVHLEQAVERHGVSALVVHTGGISTVPPLIPPTVSEDQALRAIAHEWTHLALFPSPLGLAYGSSAQARAINETTADLVGEEVAAAVLGFAGEGTGASGDQALRDELRRIRTEVDRLLDAGLVEAAESYMGREREWLEAQGYRIRRLNQAFFAFHGSYAAGPAPTTEVPDLLRELRGASANLGEFLGRVGKVTSLGDLRRAVEAATGRAAPQR